jgi:drug/metabolite transporter (DMT)-like permease
MPLTSPVLGLLLVVLIWGGNFTATKLALAEITPLAFITVRFAFGTVLMWLVLARREGWRLPPRDTWVPLIGLGIVGNTIYQLCFMTGLNRTTATNSSLILASMPTVVTVAAGWLGLEQVAARQVSGGWPSRRLVSCWSSRRAALRPVVATSSVICSCSRPWPAGRPTRSACGP